MLGGQGTLWVGMSIQNKLLGDKPEGLCNCLNLDLMSVTILAFPHGNSKGEELVREDVWRLDFAGGIVIEPAVYLPRFPVAMPLGSIHCCSADHFPCSALKTLNLSQRGMAASFHCWMLGNGNAVSKDERKSMSDRAEVYQNNCWAFEGWDAMSAITFSTLGTCTVVKQPAWAQYSMKTRPRRRQPAVGDLDFEAILSTQLTIGVLLHSVLSGVCLELTYSNATPTARTSAASSKSEFVSQPLGMSTETASFAMSSRNFSLQTTGGVLSQRENQTSPAPSAAASW
jgi:hypothetical protein